MNQTNYLNLMLIPFTSKKGREKLIEKPKKRFGPEYDCQCWREQPTSSWPSFSYGTRFVGTGLCSLPPLSLFLSLAFVQGSEMED